MILIHYLEEQSVVAVDDGNDDVVNAADDDGGNGMVTCFSSCVRYLSHQAL